MSPEGKGPKQFIPEQKKPALSPAEELKSLEKLGSIEKIIRYQSLGIQPADVDDVAQETRIAMNESIKKGNFDENKGKLNTYLIKVIQSKLADLYRKKQKHSSSELYDNIADPKTPIEDWIEKAYTAGMVSQLPAREKKAIELMLQGYNYPSIGKELNLTPIRVARVIFEAKQKLREMSPKIKKK